MWGPWPWGSEVTDRLRAANGVDNLLILLSRRTSSALVDSLGWKFRAKYIEHNGQKECAMNKTNPLLASTILQ